MKINPRSVVLGGVLLASFSLIGCQYRSPKDRYILVADNLKLTYWTDVQAGFNDAGKQYRVTTEIAGPDGYDPAAEVAALQKAIASKPAGILVSAADAAKLTAPINDAIAAGIPVITVDSDAPLSSRLYFIGTNNLEAGRTGARQLVERLHGKGNIVVYSIPGQPNIEERLKGYKDVLAGSPGIKIVEVVATGGDANNAFDSMDAYIHKSGPDKIDAFVCLESASGDAVGEVLKRQNVKDRIAIAMDVSADTLNFINDGTLDSTIAQKPYTMGFFGLKMLDEASRSKPAEFRKSYAVYGRSPYPAFIDTGSALITKYNAGSFQSAAN